MIGRDPFWAVAPVLGRQTKLAISPSSTVHNGQDDTKSVALEFQFHAAFVTDGMSGNIFELARK